MSGGWLGIPSEEDVARRNPFLGLAADSKRIMSSFTGDPQGGPRPEDDGPLLVMPPPA